MPGLVFSTVLWSLIGLLAYFLTSCTGTVMPGPFDAQVEHPSKASTVFAPSDGDAVPLLASMLDVMSDVEQLPAPPCNTWQPWYGNGAIAAYGHASCVAGRQFVAVFQHSFVHLEPERPSWLLVTTEQSPQPIPLTPFGYQGCWLMTGTDKRFLHAIFPEEGTVLTQEPGRLVLRWTPSASLVGATFIAQAVWAEPGANAANALLSPALRIKVGSVAKPLQ